MGELSSSVVAYKRGQISADALGQHFARARVLAHSPSFSWENADLSRVLDLVVEASNEPRFVSSEPRQVADRLVAVADEERAALKLGAEKLRSVLAPHLKLSNFLGGRRFDSLLRGTGLHAEVAKAFGEHRPLPDLSRFSKSLESQTSMLNKLGVGAHNDIAASKLKALGGFEVKAINPKLFETADWLRKLPDPAPWLRGFQKQGGSWREAMKEALPANWRELKSDELKQAVELMKADGLNLAWAPRKELVRQLITAKTHTNRCRILIDNREEIIEDVQSVLQSIERHDLQPVAEAGFEAICTYRDGHPAPAQTYAAAAVGEILHGPLGYETFGEVKRTFRGKDPINDVGFRSFPLFAVGHALARTLDRFKDAGDGFNRNLTQHRIGSPHSEPNLLTVLLLLAGLLPEVERMLNRHDARQEAEAA